MTTATPHDFIETFSGVRFRPLAPLSADVKLQDIAHALSHQCRFSGHTRDFYSVAEHSVRVSWLLERWGHTKQTQLWGLMHDASEAYLQDVASPLKRQALFEPYRAAERELMRVICHAFELPSKQPAAVTEADLVLLATEARDLMKCVPEHWAGLMAQTAPLTEKIVPWAPREARRKFFSRFVDLRFALMLGKKGRQS
jgi:5'-deoxynucleotidase YfbR-like HD superfamily hydrolase